MHGTLDHLFQAPYALNLALHVLSTHKIGQQTAERRFDTTSFAKPKAYLGPRPSGSVAWPYCRPHMPQNIAQALGYSCTTDSILSTSRFVNILIMYHTLSAYTV